MSDRVPEGTCETIMHFSGPGASGDVQCAIGWEGATPFDSADRLVVVSALENLMGNLSVAITLVSVSFDAGTNDPVNPIFEEPSGEGGAAGGEMMPLNSCYLVQKRTNTGGRRGRGRMYLPGVAIGATEEDGTVSIGVVGGIETNFAAMLAEMPAGWSPALMHATAPFLPTPIAAFAPQGKIATQRTRLRD